jgi:hypothetical protein
MKNSLRPRPNAKATRGCESTRFMECSHLTIDASDFSNRWRAL